MKALPIADSLNTLREKVMAKGFASATGCYVDKASGAMIYDVEGREYIDFTGGIAVMNVGHSHPRVVAAIKERLDGPKPEIIVNRFQARMFSAGLRLADLKQVLGDAFTAAVPNDYPLVREAIDRGVPLDEIKPSNKITAEIKRLVLGAAADKQAEAGSVPLMKKLKLAG